MPNYAKTKYLEQKLLNHVLLGVEYTPPAQMYLALFTSDPGRNGNVANEVNDPAYARQLITFEPAEDDPESGSYCQNTALIRFPQATQDWGDVSYGAIMDSLTGGNMLYKGPFIKKKQVLEDDYFEVPAGELKVLED